VGVPHVDAAFQSAWVPWALRASAKRRQFPPAEQQTATALRNIALSGDQERSVFIRLHPFDSRRPLRAGRGELVSPRTPYLIQLSSGSALVTVFRTPRGGETLAENGTATRWLCPLSASLGWSVTLGLCCCVVAAYTFERAKRGFFRLNGLTTSRRCGILCLKRCVALNGARTACGVYGQTGEEFFCKTKPVCHNGLQGWALRRIFYFGRPRDGVWVQNSGASGERKCPERARNGSKTG